MLGMLCWQERGQVRLERTRVAGMQVLCAYAGLGGRRQARQLARAEKLLRRAGVRRMLENSGGQPNLPGLPVVDALPLYRAVAGRLALAQLNARGISPERATVLLRGEYPDCDLVAAARLLCPWVQQVVVDTERGGEALQRNLLLQFGVAVGPMREQREVLTVRFSGESQGEDLVLCDRMELNGLTVDVPQLELPETLARAGALCALWQAGFLALSQFRVSGAEQENKCT